MANTLPSINLTGTDYGNYQLNTSIGGSFGINGVTGQSNVSTSGTGAHTHTITGATATANSNTTHNHPYTTQSINGNVTQTWHTQPYISLPQFVFVGL